MVLFKAIQINIGAILLISLFVMNPGTRYAAAAAAAAAAAVAAVAAATMTSQIVELFNWQVTADADLTGNGKEE